jgi:hypothetical protein
MTKQLFIIEYESAHWCGGQSNVVVWAEDEAHAEILAEAHMEETMRELFSDEYEEEGLDDESAVTINSVEPFCLGHEQWVFFLDPSQDQFYPVIGEEKCD